MLSRMVKHAGKAQAGLLAVGVRAVPDQEDGQPYSSPLVPRDPRKGFGSPEAAEGEAAVRDVLTPQEPDADLTVLHDTGTDVDPDYLLRDRRMAEIKRGPLMSRGPVRRELEGYEAELHGLKRSKQLVPAQRSKRLCDKLNVLYGQHVIEITLSLSSQGFKAFTEAGFKRLHKRLDTLKRRRDAIEAALEDGNMQKALDLTRRALLACQRFEQHLARVLREAKYEERFHASRAKTALGFVAAGSLIIIGISFNFFGYLPPGLISGHAMSTISKLTASGTVLCFTYAAYSYLRSKEAQEYISHLRRISIDIESFKHDFLDQKDEAEIATEHADA